MAGWRFYGRERELEQVRTLLHLGDPGPQGRRWAAYTLLGRRGIGKKRLLAQAMEEKPDAVPVLTVELPDTGRRDDCLRTLERAITQSGLGSLMADRPEDTDGRWATANPQGRFTDILSHLIGKGAVVVLDEFHNARSAGIESPLKLMIDHFTSLPSFGRRSPPGKLVLTGSHQQHLLRMLRSDAPLHQRATALARIRQWPVSTTLEMAAEHGLLARPGRFLSLWTAWDGLPRNWERLIEDPRNAALLDPAALAADDDWRRAFLQIERETLEDPEERVDSRAAVELSEDARAALIWMSRQSARGAGTREIASGAGLASRDAADRALRILETHLELVRWDGPMLAASPGRGAWRITDNNSLFQLNVFPDLFTSGRSAATTRRDPEMELTWLKNLEGPMLERLASGWVSSLPCGVWSETGVRFPQPGERGDRSRGPGAPGRRRLACSRGMHAQCRQARSGRPGPADRRFPRSTRRCPSGDRDARRDASPHDCLAGLHIRAEADTAAGRFLRLDFRDMAEQFGLDPGPGPGSASEAKPAGPPGSFEP